MRTTMTGQDYRTMVIRSIWCWTASAVRSGRPRHRPPACRSADRLAYPLSGQDQRPLRIVAFAEAWARDVTAEMAQEVSALADQDLSLRCGTSWSGRDERSRSASYRAAPSIPASRPSITSISPSPRSTPSARPVRPISRARHHEGWRLSATIMTMEPSQGPRSNGRPCSGYWPIFGPTGSTSWWSTKSTG